jgi:hypothetical protein
VEDPAQEFHTGQQIAAGIPLDCAEATLVTPLMAPYAQTSWAGGDFFASHVPASNLGCFDNCLAEPASNILVIEQPVWPTPFNFEYSEAVSQPFMSDNYATNSFTSSATPSSFALDPVFGSAAISPPASQEVFQRPAQGQLL